MEKYDILVVGTGTAAQTLIGDIRDSHEDFNIAVVGTYPAGGVCALEGCNAKKFSYEIAHTMIKLSHLFGSGIVQMAIPSWENMLMKKNAFTDPIPERTISGLKKQGVTYYEGTAKFVDGTTMLVGDEVLSAKYIVLATGARPRELDIVGKEFLFTNNEFLDQKKLSHKYVFIGGGFVNAEFATIVTGFGAEATIVSHSERLLSSFDKDMVGMWQKAANADGINFKLGVGIEKIQKRSGKKDFRVFLSDGEILYADCVVNGTGRVPNIEELDTDKAGISTSPRGIRVDSYMQTTSPNIFALGDCADTVQLARVADYEAHITAASLMNKLLDKGELISAKYDIAPAILFTYPQLAMVGTTEEILRKRGMKLGVDYERSMSTNLRWANYLRDGSRFASYKILVDQDHRILGAHVLSPNPAGCINIIKTAMMHKKTVEELWGEAVLSPYPTHDSDLSYMLGPLVKNSPAYERIKY